MISARGGYTRRGPFVFRSRLLCVQLSEIRGQSPRDKNSGPQGYGRGDEAVSAPGNHALGFPLRALSPQRVEVEPRHHDADADQAELYQERAVGDVFRWLRHPQGESAADLQNDGNPNNREQPAERGERNRAEESQQSQSHDEDETNYDRGSQRVDGQRERPAPQRLAPRPF